MVAIGWHQTDFCHKMGKFGQKFINLEMTAQKNCYGISSVKVISINNFLNFEVGPMHYT